MLVARFSLTPSISFCKYGQGWYKIDEQYSDLMQATGVGPCKLDCNVRSEAEAFGSLMYGFAR